MKLELKSIKHSIKASHETHCYEAHLLMDGKIIALVGNKGKGAKDYIKPYDNKKIADYTRSMRRIREYIQSLGFTLEDWCNEKVNSHLDKLELKKLLKQMVGKKDNSLYHFTCAKNDVNIAELESRGYEVLNAMKFKDALKIFQEVG